MSADEKARMSTANIIRLVQTVLVAAVAAFAISVVVAGHWWTAPVSQLTIRIAGTGAPAHAERQPSGDDVGNQRAGPGIDRAGRGQGRQILSGRPQYAQ